LQGNELFVSFMSCPHLDVLLMFQDSELRGSKSCPPLDFLMTFQGSELFVTLVCNDDR
jgi:hypothetical protein